MIPVLAEITFPNIDPVWFHIGPIPIRWYALAYIAGIVLGWMYVVKLLKMDRLWAGPHKGNPPISREGLDDLLFWVTLGIILGGRLGYVLFYEPSLLTQPWVSVADMMGGTGFIQTVLGWIHIPPALMIWTGGMSFHGGLLGVTLAGFLFSRRNKLNALAVGDLFACAAPLGLLFGRIANFINGELYGRETTASWGMVFPSDPQQLVRHPSQLYEAALEGLVLFLVIAFVTHRLNGLRKPGFTIGMFLAGYGTARSIVENFRQPDVHMPDFPLGLTMGIMLSLPMIGLGCFLMWRAHKNDQATQKATNTASASLKDKEQSDRPSEQKADDKAL